MTQIPIQIRKQLTQLGKIHISEADNASAVVVDTRIGDLSHKDLKRAMYVVSNSFIEITHKQKVIVDVIKNTQKLVDDVLTDGSLTIEEVRVKIRELVLELPKPDVPILE